MNQDETVTKSTGSVISCEQLNDMLGDSNLVVLMTTMTNPVNAEKDPPPAGYIPGAQFFDFENEICDPHSGLPHTMPGAELFERKVSELGISNDTFIVVYDNIGIYCSARVWWMFKAMGHENVAVLDGGLPAWLNSGFELCKDLSPSVPSVFKAHPDRSLFCGASEVLQAINDDHFAILDARSYQRFYGQVPEPREGVRSGHIPHSKNLPFANVLDENQAMKPVEELTVMLQQLGLSQDKKLIFSCGSGVTACILALAATQSGYENLSVYDGSWSDWGADASLPVSLLD